MKKFKWTILLLSVAILQLQAAKPFAKIEKLNAVPYPGHIELTWNNYEGFCYEIYVAKDGGKFLKTADTDGRQYFVFTGKADKKTNYVCRVVPKGMSVTDPEAANFEVKAEVNPATDEALLDMTQRYATRYFYEFSQPQSGMARERSNDNHGDIVTTGGTGFGIMALVAGAERNYITREQSYATINKIVNFLNQVERFHGAWSHWYDAATGKPFAFSKYDDGGDLVETAFLVQGLLTARKYFENGTADEQNLSQRISKLWEEVEWNWYTKGTDSLYWHWSKNYNFKMNHRIKGYDETMITYVLAASSPTYPITGKVFEASYKNSNYFLNGKTYYGIKLDLGMAYGGPLFFTHYSFLGLDPRGLTDRHTNYFERNKAHAQIHLAYAIDNPKHHAGYGADCWGFTSSDDPLVGYSSHHPNTNDDNGTISPTAALSSIVYTPEASMRALKHFYYDFQGKLWGPCGFYDAFNPSLYAGQQVVRSYLAIDEGPIACMLENYRSGLLWKYFMQNTEIEQGLNKMGIKYQK